jgi:hypothetical protein
VFPGQKSAGSGSVLHVVGQFYTVDGRQQAAFRRQDIPAADDVQVRVRQAEPLHNVVVFLERLVILRFGVVRVLFSNPQYNHASLPDKAFILTPPIVLPSHHLKQRGWRLSYGTSLSPGRIIKHKKAGRRYKQNINFKRGGGK